MRHKLFQSGAMNRRLTFAGEIEKKIKSACWAQLVGWAHGTTEFEACFSQICRPDSAPYAYCGKCDEYFKQSEVA